MYSRRIKPSEGEEREVQQTGKNWRIYIGQQLFQPYNIQSLGEICGIFRLINADILIIATVDMFPN